MSEDEAEQIISEDESSTSEEEDEDGKEWTEETEKTFLKTLSSLKRKDPKIYDANIKFFNDEISKQNDDDEPSTARKKVPKEESMYLRDYERKIILEKNGILTDEESDDEVSNEKARKRASSPTYVEEQKALKNSFKKFLTDNNEYDSDADDTAGFLKIKVKNEEEKAKEESEYVEWLKGQKPELSDKETEGELKYLRDYWTDPNLNEGEQFLRDYVLNRKYLEEASDENQFDGELSFSEEEKILNECDEYEQKYNFRFEEPDQDFIKTYPRVIEDSLRRRDEKRKQKREERKKRKAEQLAQKYSEVKRLKKQKKEEFMEKIEKLKKLTGNRTLGFDDEELERDFNPEEFDKKMNDIFNDEFYSREENLDPNFDIEENEGNEEEDFIMDCDYDPEATRESKFKKQTRSSRRKGHKKTTFAEAVEKEKPVFDPEDKTYQEYLDEYYGLDFEDIIDDLPCRFKYREVKPIDFGLTVEEILAADDKELNNWCSMKKIDTIRPEQKEKYDEQEYRKRSQNLELKKKYLPSLFNNESNAEGTELNTEPTAKKKKKRGKRKSANSSKSIQDGIIKFESEGRKRKAEGNSEEISAKENKKMKRSSDHCESHSTTEKLGKPKASHFQKRKSANLSESIPASNKIEGDGIKVKVEGNVEESESVEKLRTSNFEKGKSADLLKNIEAYPKTKNKSKKVKTKKNSDECKNNPDAKLPVSKKTKRRFDNFKSNRNVVDSKLTISDERLKAYGFNPKRYKNKMKYGQSNR